MATDISMPQLGESIAEGTVVKWLVPVGGMIEKDQSLLEVETEKVALEIPSPATGVLTEILVQEGETVPVGTLLARIASTPPSEAINRVGGVVVRPMEPIPEGEGHHSPAVRQLAKAEGVDLSQVIGTGAGGRRRTLVGSPPPHPLRPTYRREDCWSRAAAAPPEQAEGLVDAFTNALRDLGAPIATGQFAARMQLELVNDGPVTLLIEA